MSQTPTDSTGSPRRLSREEREAYLAEPHVGTLSVADDDDRPPSTLPTRYAYEPGGTISIVTRRGKRKSRLIQAAGVVSLSVQRGQVPYRYVTVEETVVRQEPATRDQMVPILRRYLSTTTLLARFTPAASGVDLERLRRLLATPVFATVATLGRDGASHQSVVWVDRDGDDVVFTIARASLDR